MLKFPEMSNFKVAHRKIHKWNDFGSDIIGSKGAYKGFLTYNTPEMVLNIYSDSILRMRVVLEAYICNSASWQVWFYPLALKGPVQFRVRNFYQRFRFLRSKMWLRSLHSASRRCSGCWSIKWEPPSILAHMNASLFFLKWEIAEEFPAFYITERIVKLILFSISTFGALTGM